MSDTIRTRAQLQSLLADNAPNKEITAQRIRDFLVSVLGVYGGIYVNDNATGQGTTTTPAPITAFDQNSPAAGVTPDSANDKLTIDADADGDYLIICQLSFSGTNNASFEFEFYLNGSPTGYKMDRKLGSGGDVGSGTMFGLASIAAADEIEVYVAAVSGTPTIVVEQAQLFAIRIG